MTLGKPFEGTFSVDTDHKTLLFTAGTYVSPLEPMPNPDQYILYADANEDMIILQALNLALPVMAEVGETKTKGNPIHVGKYGNMEALRLHQPFHRCTLWKVGCKH